MSTPITPHQSLQELEEKVIKLLESYKKQKEDVLRLEMDNDNLKMLVGNTVEAHREQNFSELVTKVKDHIRDIDKCIKYLEQQ